MHKFMVDNIVAIICSESFLKYILDFYKAHFLQ